MKNAKTRILTGDRPTGRLHLGHYAGSLRNRVRLQNEYETFVLLADIQALTTHFERPELIRESILHVALDNLAVGIDPESVTFVQQSRIAAIAELTVIFSMFVPVNRLGDNPTVKTEARQYGYDSLTYGFLGYPVSQAADVLFCGAELVPVGEDQLPHMEECSRIARRFNRLYGETFAVPKALMSNCPRLPGLDGNSKMGKSLGNAVYLSDTADEVSGKIKSAVTDTSRVHANDPGHPDVCVVCEYHKTFNAEECENICEMCTNGSIGCTACKQSLTDALNALLDPFRERRAYYEARTGVVKDHIAEGSRKANRIGGETLGRVKSAMHLCN